jgi:DNA-directed RNA polymerase specialized sigma24 family protein
MSTLRERTTIPVPGVDTSIGRSREYKAKSFGNGASVVQKTEESKFNAFVNNEGLRLRRVFTARYGVEVGGDVHAEAMAWAWEHWEALQAMANPVGYLYRVAQSSARPHRRWLRRTTFPAQMPDRWHLDGDNSLIDSMRALTDTQRISVLMVHGYNSTYAEVAEVLDCSISAVTNHVHRGLAALRRQLNAEEQ